MKAPVWIAEADKANPPSWHILNSSTGRVIVYNLTEKDAKEFADRRNKQQEKREK